ncbi:MAG: O-antigen ligase family protein [Candidatus Magasanikbacteria bacterium]
MMFFIILIIWLIKQNKNIIYHLSLIIKKNKLLFLGITLFLFAATISIFTSSNLKSALGEWKAFYIEPLLMFFIIITTQNNITIKQYNNKTIRPEFNKIIFALILSGLATSILSIYQHFTGWMVPWDFWQNNETFRVTAWYGFPNAVGLYLAPLWPLAFYGLKRSIINLKTKDWKKYLFLIPYSLFLILSPLAIFYAKSTGALIGLTVGIGILLLAYKKTRWITVILIIICLSGLLSFSGFSNLRNEVTFQDRSGQIRLSMWSDTVEFLKDHPIAGAGLASYTEKMIPYHTTVNTEGVEIFHHPHNIFLTMWVNLGLLGLLGFVIILISIIKNCFQISREHLFFSTNFKFQIFILSSLVVIIVMGLVDSPYIKNDLAIFFWLLPALLIAHQSQSV